MAKYEIVRLTDHVIDGNLLQYNVEGRENNGPIKRLGYVGTQPTDYFAPLCYFDMTQAADVQKQIERIKLESSRKATSEKVS